MAALRERQIQDVRDWIKSVLSITDDSKVIKYREVDSNHPPEPFIAVEISSSDGRVMGENIKGTKNGNASHKSHQLWDSTLTLHGFGNKSESWLESLTLSLDNPKVRETLRESGVVLTPNSGGIGEVSEIVATQYEARFVWELSVGIRVLGDEVETYQSADSLGANVDLEHAGVDVSFNFET